MNELVLARTDRILHSYSLQISKPVSPNTSAHPNSQPLNLVRLLSRSSSISTAESSGLLSPLEERRETVIHYPFLSSTGRQYYGGSAAATGGSETQEGSLGVDSSNRLILVEKKRWALDGQVHSRFVGGFRSQSVSSVNHFILTHASFLTSYRSTVSR